MKWSRLSWLSLLLAADSSSAFSASRTQPRAATSLSVATSVPPASAQQQQQDSGVWYPGSWRNKKVAQPPNYESEAELEGAVATIRKYSPLVFAGEVRSLHEQLAKACSGQGFLLMGGDCAESFNEFNVDHVRDTFRIMLQMALVLTFGSAMPIIKVGRMAGQFAKPRSEPDEVIDGVTLPSYRGDILNSEEFTPESRRHNPANMIKAYHQSAQTLNILRAFSTGGYADISRLHAWNLDFVEQTDEGSRYVCLCLVSSRRFMQILTLDFIVIETLPPRWMNHCVS
jgi:3-deoxy-7-phosphoheptulonate synthase